MKHFLIHFLTFCNQIFKTFSHQKFENFSKHTLETFPIIFQACVDRLREHVLRVDGDPDAVHDLQRKGNLRRRQPERSGRTRSGLNLGGLVQHEEVRKRFKFN